MIRRLIHLTAFALCAAFCSAQGIATTPRTDVGPTRDGWSTHLAFELTTPTGSHGRWSTGGGATLTTTYTWFVAPNWFITPGVGAFYNTLGTDFMPEYGNLYEGTIKNIGIRIPLLTGYNLKLPGDFSLSFATGPTLNISVYAKEHATPNFQADIVEPADPVNLFGRGFNHVDVQWSFYAGLTYKEHYCVGITAGLGLSHVATISDNACTLNVHRNNVAIMLSYKF